MSKEGSGPISGPAGLGFESVRYELTAVICHLGNDTTRGHYTAICKDVSTGQVSLSLSLSIYIYIYIYIYRCVYIYIYIQYSWCFVVPCICCLYNIVYNIYIYVYIVEEL